MSRITIREFGGGPPDWLAAIETAGGAALQQHWAYGALAGAAGRQVARLELCAAGARIGLAQMLARPGLRVLNRGPVWCGAPDAATRRQALRALARGPGVTLATPEDPVAGFGLVPLLTPRHQAIWDLSPEVAALRAGLTGKWRNRLAGAERALRLRRDTDPGWILAAEARQQRERGYRSLPAALVRAFPARDVLALAALGRDGPAPLAGVIFLRHGSVATYQTGWTGPGGRGCGAHQFLLWQAALILRGQGVRRLDLGNVDSAGAGRMRFKLGTGARAVALGATCLLLPRPSWRGGG